MIAVLHQRLHKHFTRLVLRIRNNFQNDIQLSEYYFGYGANLNVSRFHNNYMKAQEVGVANLLNHELKFSLATEYKSKSYAGVHYKEKAMVPGVLVKIDKLSLKYLDKLEWCGFGAYKRVKKEVECGSEKIEAWVYEVAKPDFDRMPSTLYLQNMIKAAKVGNFPKEFISFLENHPHKDSFEIDHGFSLLTYSSSRKLVKELKLIYVIHDKLRNKLCDLI